MKIELPLAREPHFHCPRGLENQCFFNLFSTFCPRGLRSTLLEPFLAFLARFWLDLGIPWGAQLPHFSHPFFDTVLRPFQGPPGTPPGEGRRQGRHPPTEYLGKLCSLCPWVFAPEAPSLHVQPLWVVPSTRGRIYVACASSGRGSEFVLYRCLKNHPKVMFVSVSCLSCLSCL